MNILIFWNIPFGVDVLLTEKPGSWFAQAGTEICPFWVPFSHFTVANQLPGFSISRLANVEDFLKVNIFSNCKCKCEYKQFFI